MNYEVIEFQRLHALRGDELGAMAKWLDANVENDAILDSVYISVENRFKTALAYFVAAGSAVASLIDLVEAERVSAAKREVDALRRRVALMEKQARSAGLDPSLVFWAGSGPPY